MEIAQRGPGETQTYVLLSWIRVKFEIDSYSVRLVGEEAFPELQDLTEGSWTPSSLLYELSERGIHLLPVDEDYE